MFFFSRRRGHTAEGSVSWAPRCIIKANFRRGARIPGGGVSFFTRWVGNGRPDQLRDAAVSYAHVTLPTKNEVLMSVVSVHL